MFRQGSSSLKIPRVSGYLSGLVGLRKASTSPTAGMYSGMNGLSLASISTYLG